MHRMITLRCSCRQTRRSAGRALISYGSHAVGASLDEACRIRKQRDLAIKYFSVGAAPWCARVRIALVDGLVAWQGFEGLLRGLLPRSYAIAVSLNDATGFAPGAAFSNVLRTAI